MCIHREMFFAKRRRLIKWDKKEGGHKEDLKNMQSIYLRPFQTSRFILHFVLIVKGNCVFKH